MAPIAGALLFVDDSAFVKFVDGSSLQLSSCGAVYRCSASSVHDAVNRHALCGKETQQLSQFTTTLWKKRVQLALDFRNKFAKIPYVCQHLLGMDVVEKKTAFTSVCTWPGADIKENILQHKDGSVTMKSLEGNAAIILSACRETFAAKFLCQVPSERHDSTENCVYCWVQQVYSINALYPCCFHYPVNILLNGTMPQTEENASCVVGELPRSLPLHCKKAHMHKWRKHLIEENVASDFMEMDSVKALYSEGVFYRFYHQKYFIAEAILPDGSVVRSEGPTQLYFKHYIYDSETGKVKENTYSIKALPVHKKDQPYFISKILKTLNRYLNCLSQCGSGYGFFTCCWKSEDDPFSIHSLSGLELESSIYVRGLAAFKMYINGRIHIVFCDGSIMDLFQPDPRENFKEDGYQTSKNSERTTLVDKHEFCLILPNGISCKGSLRQPGIFERYAQAALEFVEWRRWEAEKKLNLDDEKASLVVTELDKLKRFNALFRSEQQKPFKLINQSKSVTVEMNPQTVHCANSQRANEERHANSFETYTDMNGKSSVTTTPLSEIQNMQEHLRDTRRTVDEIESVLENCRKHFTKY